MSAERPAREVAYRLFAAEFDDADFTYAESDEERAPNYVVTPTGARVNRVFVVGVLTEVEPVSDDVLRARIVDPTGAFVVYAGQYQPEALAFFERAEVPTFVAVTGKARTFQPEDSDRIYTSIRPESANAVTAETRDRWVVQTAEHTIDRIDAFAGALDQRGLPRGLASGIPKAMDHYGTTTGYLAAMRELAIDAARLVANEIDEVEQPTLAPDEGGDVVLDFESSLPEVEYDTGTTPQAAAESADVDAATDLDTEEADAAAEAALDTAAEETDEGEVGTPDAPDDAEASAEGDDETASAEGEAGDGASTEAEAEQADEPEAAPEATEDVDAPVDTDEMYEFSEEEREEVEEEYGLGFETGNEVQEPGEADIETPTPEDEVDEGAEASAEPTPDDEPEPETAPEDETEPEDEPEPTDESEPETAPEDETEPEDESEPVAETEADDAEADSAPESAEDVDLEDAVVEAMGDLDDGNGAPRDELVAEMQSTYGVSEEAVEEAIQDALMGGRCYESDEDHITAI